MAATLARSHRSQARESEVGTALLKVGDLLAGKYRVERILGEGGMGVVVAAHHELLDQHVAVKLLYQDIADREAQSRLLLEARACAKLQSEHVARVVDVDTGADGLPFIVMELLEGADLCQIADARGALPRWLVVDYVLQAVEGLAHAHSRGIVHRDLKPSNLFLANRSDGTQIIKILDFGISKSTDPVFDSSGERKRAMQLTGGRAVLGSPPYMSPEQVRSPKTVDHRTDIWSLGIVMYELLTNSMPFGGDEINETFAQILEKEPQPIRQIVTGVPEGLERVVMKCLAKNRDHRFADVSELARALVAFGSGTWMQSADRVHATLSRGLEEAISGPRLKGGGTPQALTASDRIPIPSSPGRRIDSLQPELTGTASTVARRFTVLGSKGRSLLALAAVIGTAAVVLLAGTWFQRSRASALDEKAPELPSSFTAVSAEAPPEATALPGAAAPAAGGIVTAPVHLVGPDSEGVVGNVQNGVQQPSPTVIAPAGGAASAKKPVAAAPARPPAPPPPSPKRPTSTPAPGKPLLPPGLPRERQ
ncbi:MAG: serine/threonine protein kinase [Labilithrix sp.]|nr:serine/threonine protein kinase [Labilithrix sp.]